MLLILNKSVKNCSRSFQTKRLTNTASKIIYIKKPASLYGQLKKPQKTLVPNNDNAACQQNNGRANEGLSGCYLSYGALHSNVKTRLILLLSKASKGGTADGLACFRWGGRGKDHRYVGVETRFHSPQISLGGGLKATPGFGKL